MTAHCHSPETSRRAECPRGGPPRHDAAPTRPGCSPTSPWASWCCLWVLPTIGILLTSFRTSDDAAEGGWWKLFLHPSAFGDLTFENYKRAIQGTNLGEGFVNSLAIALPATFIPILVAAFAAYAFTFMKFWGRDVLFVIVVGMLVVPNFVSFVPMLRLFRDLGVGWRRSRRCGSSTWASACRWRSS